MAKNEKPERTKDYYGLLEVDSRARPEVIKAAFEAMTEASHEDKKMLALLEEAFGVLGDKEKREQFDEARQEVVGKVVGDYHVLRLIATGGFGKTYVGEHVLTGEKVCVKHCALISRAVDEVLIAEAKAVWNLRHFGIPQVMNLIRLPDGSLALIMSYIPGKTIWQIVEEHGPIDPEHVAWITERILNILKYLHFHGVVHGDMKPQNVIVQKEHTVVLVDYGLAMVKPDLESASKGYTKYFASPEQMTQKPLLPESDFFGLGTTMIYALSGDLEYVKRKEVPKNTPTLIKEFIERLIVRDVLSRPKWENEDLQETLVEIRKKCFGRRHSEMKPLSL